MHLNFLKCVQKRNEDFLPFNTFFSFGHFGSSFGSEPRGLSSRSLRESFDERLINEKQQTSTINVQFITTEPNVSC